ncbi:MAG: S-layer homology domain-containing protein [Acidimicrobiia bacterium]
MKDLEFRLSAKWLKRLAVTAVIGAVMVPTAVIAAGGAFTDDETSVFEANIEWLAASGVTAGCNPPDNTQFCPEDGVTRGQMAAFMQRFAQYIDAEDGSPAEADHAATSGDADTLDGFQASQLNGVRSTGGDADIIINGTSLTTDFDDLGTVAVTAPADGAFVVMWGAWMSCLGPTVDEIRLYVDGNETDLFNVEECAGTLNDRSISAHHVEPAVNGESYEFQMRGHDWDNDSESVIRDPRLTVMFIPFGIGSEAPVLDRVLQSDSRPQLPAGEPGS